MRSHCISNCKRASRVQAIMGNFHDHHIMHTPCAHYCVRYGNPLMRSAFNLKALKAHFIYIYIYTTKLVHIPLLLLMLALLRLLLRFTTGDVDALLSMLLRIIVVVAVTWYITVPVSVWVIDHSHRLNHRYTRVVVTGILQIMMKTIFIDDHQRGIS